MNKDILKILDNVRYWETCPDDYKKTIEQFLSDTNQDLQLQQGGVSGSGIIGNITPSLIKENDCFGCVRRNTDYDCLQCDLPNGYHYR